jgi:transcriptional regulator with XRE-family HTH domain
MNPSVIGCRIQERLRALGISARRASIQATGNPDLVREIQKGKTSYPRADTLQKLAAVLGCSVHFLLGKDEVAAVRPDPHDRIAIEGPQLIRRLKAARWAYQDDERKAAADLGIAVEALRDIEAGRAEIGTDFLLSFARVTGTPADWLFFGRITAAMDPRMAARIALFDPGTLEMAGSRQA